MNYAVEMGSGTIIYIPSFINIGSGIQKFICGDTHMHVCPHASAHTGTWPLKPIFFFQNKESRLRMKRVLSFFSLFKVKKLKASEEVNEELTRLCLGLLLLPTVPVSKSKRWLAAAKLLIKNWLLCEVWLAKLSKEGTWLYTMSIDWDFWSREEDRNENF
jgi:hypothetical protein